jgi:hypothetical protein
MLPGVTARLLLVVMLSPPGSSNPHALSPGEVILYREEPVCITEKAVEISRFG